MRIGVLASIAHRTPPASLRAVGAGRVDPRGGARRPRPRRHAVRHRRLADRRRGCTPRRPPGYEEDPGVDVKVYEGLHNAAAFERAGEFDVICNQFDFLPLTYSRLVSTPVVTTIHGFSSERIVPVYRAYDDIAHYVSISDADRHPDLTYDATIHHGIDLSPFTFRDRATATTCCSSAASIPTRAPTGRSRSPAGPACRWSSPGSCRTRTTSGSCVEPHVDGARRPLRRPGRAGRAGRAARRRAGVAAPHRLRRAVRAVGRRGAGHRDAGDRHAARVDARDHPRRRRPASSSTTSTRRSRRSAGCRRSTGPSAARDAETRFSADRMVDDYIALFQRLTSGSDPGTVEVQG